MYAYVIISLYFYVIPKKSGLNIVPSTFTVNKKQ